MTKKSKVAIIIKLNNSNERLSMERPICINIGCNSPVSAMSGKITDPNPRWRIHCGHCQAASYGKWSHKPEVTPFKKGKCSNIDEHLGFPCPINYRKAKWMIGQTQVDHKDGDHTNNSLDNLDELCACCHTEKGRRNGDFRRGRYKKLRG